MVRRRSASACRCSASECWRPPYYWACRGELGHDKLQALLCGKLDEEGHDRGMGTHKMSITSPASPIAIADQPDCDQVCPRL